MVLRDGRRTGGKVDCFAPHISSDPWPDQADRAREVALDYYQRILRLTPGDGRVRSLHDETRSGLVKAWSFCAD